MGTLALGLYLPARNHAQDREEAAQPAVFVMTNDADHNEVLSYQRAPNGQLFEGRRCATGGRGSGGGIDPLGSQGSLNVWKCFRNIHKPTVEPSSAVIPASFFYLEITGLGPRSMTAYEVITC